MVLGACGEQPGQCTCLRPWTTSRSTWTREEVDQRLRNIMIAIHKNCFDTADKYGTPGNYLNGANIGGFLKVANAMMDQGLV